MAFNWRDILGGGSLTSFTPSAVNPSYPAGNVPVSARGSGMHPGMESGYQPTYGTLNQPPVLGVPQLGYKPVSNISTSTGAPDQRSWFDKLDKQALEDLAGLSAPQREKPRFGGAAPVSYGRPRGGNIAPSQSNDPSFAPNPGFGLVLSSREKDRFSGTS